MKNNNLQNFLFVMGVLVVGIITIALFRTPRPQLANASEKEFSAYRAFEHIKQIAQKPHSMGTDEHERVKNYIIDELKKLNLKIVVQTTTAINYDGGIEAGYVHNIIGTIKGNSSKKAVLVVGHYDSQPNTLGAADDGSAVAAMLEAARALNGFGTFNNDVIFLFTDGEEAGLFGAKAFVDENSLKDSIGIVLNIEARGSSGPCITYEVSPQNGWIMREYAKAVPYPIANSIAYEIYKLLPNDSDFTPLKNFGLSGFNIGFIDEFVNYHSMTDSPENLNLGSLQHHGSYIMGIATHFGNLNLSNTKSEDVIYFNWIGHSLVLFPIGFNIFFVILVSLLLISVISIGIRKGRLSISKILIGGLTFILTIAITILFTWLLLITIKAIYPHYSNFYSSNFYNVADYFTVFTCLALVIYSTIYVLLFKKISAENLLLGLLLVNYIIIIALLYFIPTGAYLFIIPTMLILAGLLINYSFNFSFENKPLAFLSIHFISIIPVIFLYLPMIGLFFITFGLGTIYIGVVFVIILMGYLIMGVKSFYDRAKWSLPVIALFFLVGKLIAGQLTSGYSKKQPLQSNVSYILNSDSNEAYWFSSKQFMDDWKSQFFAEPELKPLSILYPKSSYKYLQNKADIYPQSLPELKILSDSMINGIRNIQLVITSARKAQNCLVRVKTNANLSALIINNKAIVSAQFFKDTVGGYYSFYYFGLSEKALELTLKPTSKEKLELILIESKLGLPDFESFKPMPDYIIPDKGFMSNVTLVKRTWNL